jgi:Fic-DOC domain mobile mystery protein B
LVVSGLLPVGDGHTELTEEDREGLIPTYIANRADLYEAEQRNIAIALFRARPPLDQILTDRYLRQLHRRMFDQVWRWAGRYRKRETNVGIDPDDIAVAVRTLVDNAKAWIEYERYEPDELAVRFHHQLVYIHPFPNGNGRHGRIATNFVLEARGLDWFTWGAKSGLETDALRAVYLQALRNADAGDFAPLLAFVRT